MSTQPQTLAIVTAAVLDRGFSVQQLQNNRGAIRQLLDQVLVRGIQRDYAAIPGTDKDKMTLLKPGAEKICAVFGIAVDPKVEAIQDGEDTTFRVTCVMTSIASGAYLGSGIGEASTKESKWAWRATVCDEEFEATDPRKRRVHWKKGYNGAAPVSVKQVREDPNDKANTVLKMAKKRAMIDGVLSVTAASDTFTQDLEDRTETSGQRSSAPVTGAQAQAAQQQPEEPAITADQSKRFYGIWKNTPGRTKEIVQEYLRVHCGGITDDRKMPARMYDAACAWAKSGQPVPPPAPAEKKAAAPAAAQAQQQPESDEMRAVKELFGYTGHDLAQQAALFEKYKDDLKGLVDFLKEELN